MPRSQEIYNYMATPFQWLPEYSVNVKEIDEQHQHFLEILSQLYSAILARQSAEVLVEIVKDLLAYKELHFATEEKYFEQFHYEGAEAHKAQHQELRQRVEEFQKVFTGQNFEQAMLLLDFLENWLIAHIGQVDKKYTKCFNEHGLY